MPTYTTSVFLLTVKYWMIFLYRFVLKDCICIKFSSRGVIHLKWYWNTYSTLSNHTQYVHSRADSLGENKDGSDGEGVVYRRQPQFTALDTQFT